MVRFISTVVLLACSASLALGGDFTYTGVNTCKMCHKKDDTGNQFGVWSGTRHAGSLETLKSEKAAELAKERGLQGAPYESGECLQCHTTGWGTESGYQVLSEEFIANEDNARAVRKNGYLANVGCESCHGPGSGYKSKSKMEGIYSGEIEADSVGLTTPTEEVCQGCHNEKSPTFTEFDFEAMVAKIAHPFPEGME